MQTAFPNFFKIATQNWWTDEIIRFFTQLKFDALWIVSSFKIHAISHSMAFNKCLGHERAI